MTEHDRNPGDNKQPTSATDHLQDAVGRVRRIRLTGQPRTILVDETTLFTSEGAIPASLLEKLQVLTTDEGMRLAVLSSDGESVRKRLSGVEHLVVWSSVEAGHLEEPSLAVVGTTRQLPPQVYAWYAGSGDASSLHAVRNSGPEVTDGILGLFGTALVQERAGIAFRAAGVGKPIPSEAPFNTGILDGITRTLEAHPRQVHQLQGEAASPVDLAAETGRLIEAALAPILEGQATSGAVAAAPPPASPDAPNYWFFWQRDAGNVVIPLTRLVRYPGYAHLHDRVQHFIDRYVEFVERLPHGKDMTIAQLGVSRFDMDGKPIESYGSPQKDGPSYTVLAVVAALGESARAYAICRPYLEYLHEYIDGPTFDPWEFAVGDIFNDDNLARRALRSGARLAHRQGDGAAAERYRAKADDLERTLRTFQEPEEHYILGGRDFLQPWLGTISGLDIDVVGSVLTAYDVDDPVLNVDDPHIASTMQVLEGVFANRWPVNVAWRDAGNEGMGIGRFPEDTNDGVGSTGGNPWVFTTLWAAEFYLRSIQRHAVQGNHDPESRARLLKQADGYLQFVLQHGSADALTEQIDAQTGKPRGAKQLAWAQAELINALLIREDVIQGG